MRRQTEICSRVLQEGQREAERNQDPKWNMPAVERATDDYADALIFPFRCIQFALLATYRSERGPQRSLIARIWFPRRFRISW